jgi:pyridoxal phosphate enzyme (YggS family)
VWVDSFQRSQIAIEEAAHHGAEPRLVLREAGGIDGVTAEFQRLGEQIDLSAFAAAVDPFDGDQFSARWHESQASLTGEARRCKAAHARILHRGHAASMSWDHVKENLEAVQRRIAAAAQRAGRRVEEITLIAVSKTHPAEAIRAAYEPGVRHFGENRVQEWEGKRDGAAHLAATWHLIGHLQSNKAARAAKAFDCIDSVDDFALAQRLDRGREESGVTKKLRVLIEVRVAQEETKSGVEISEVAALAEKIAALPRLDLAGLMCIPPFLENIEEVRPHFVKLRKLRDELQVKLGLQLPVLSMGMSHDFDVAIEEGSTEVRVGTAIFGLRTRI